MITEGNHWVQAVKVLKFGGTSIGTPERMQQVARQLKNEKDILVVLSAVAGTTDKLVEVARRLSEGRKDAATRLIHDINSHHSNFVRGLFSTENGVNDGLALVKSHLGYIKAFTQDMFTVHEERAILAQGELISTGLFQQYMREIGVETDLLSALEFMRLSENGEPDEESIREKLLSAMSKESPNRFFITQGYICRNAFGEIDNLRRGGSDYTASLVGAALRCDEIQIWTDIDGIHNNDPRVVSGTRPIRKLSFDEAAELAYFGAKILHPSSIRPARSLNIPVRLLNTLDPTAEGTLITQEQGEGDIKAVAAKDGITALKIKSSRMLLAYGFLRRVFEVFERYRTPIDMITTSEVAVSLTIDNTEHIDSIADELSEFGSVQIDHEQTIICVVGDFVAERPGIAFRVLDALKEIPLRMICYGGSRHNISILIQTSLKSKALNSLHRQLFHA